MNLEEHYHAPGSRLAMAFQGSLAELHLPDIIQLISVSGKTGVFHLTDGALKGQIYLHDGKIVHAAAGGRRGRGGGLRAGHLEPGRLPVRARHRHRAAHHHQEQHQPADGGRAPAGRVAGALQEDPVHRHDARVRGPGQPRGPDQPQHQRVADPLQDRRHSAASRPSRQAADLSVFDVAKILYGLVATGLIRLQEPPRPGAGRAPRGRRRSRRGRPPPAAAPLPTPRRGRAATPARATRSCWRASTACARSATPSWARSARAS